MSLRPEIDMLAEALDDMIARHNAEVPGDKISLALVLRDRLETTTWFQGCGCKGCGFDFVAAIVAVLDADADAADAVDRSCPPPRPH